MSVGSLIHPRVFRNRGVDLLIIVVELFGIPKHVAKRRQIELDIAESNPTVGSLIQAIREHLPQLALHLGVDDDHLKDVMLCVNENQFLRDMRTPLPKIESLLLTSLDVGG